MRDVELRVVEVPVDVLVPYANNAKIHTDKQVGEIAASIEEFGNCDPIGVWTNAEGAPEIVEGHGRVLALKRLGVEVAPVIFLDHLTDEQRRAYAHVHNQTTLSSGFDMDVLLADMQELDADWKAFGFSDEGVDGMPDIVEDGMPDIVEERAKRGDVWRLGEHVLMCGDASSEADMARLFEGGAKPMMVFTDPPYGVAIGTKNKTINAVEPGRGGCIEVDIEGDTLGTDELYALLVKCFSNLRASCDEACSYYVSSPQGGELGLMMMMMMRDAGLPVRHNLIWVKSSAVFSLGRLDYDYQHEPIFYTWTKRHKFYGDYSTTVMEEDKPLEKMGKGELCDLVRALRGDPETSVIRCEKPQSSKLHPTMKPVRLIAHLMCNSSRRGDVVADVFGGSGSTLMAAEQLGRKCRMMELDPHYCDVIIARWEEFAGKRAVRA